MLSHPFVIKFHRSVSQMAKSDSSENFSFSFFFFEKINWQEKKKKDDPILPSLLTVLY